MKLGIARERNVNGDLIRQFKNSKGKIIKKEGIFSPITHNERHIRIIKDLLIKNRLIKNCLVISRVVIANPKNIVNTRYAPKYVKEPVIKYDQVTKNLKHVIDGTNNVNMSYKTIMDIAEFHVIENHTFQITITFNIFFKKTLY